MNPIFARSPETEAVAKTLRGVNGEISYQTLAASAGLQIGRLKQILSSARRILLKDKIAFGVIQNYGLKRLGDSDKVVESRADVKKLRRAAKRGKKKLSTIESFERLTPREQLVATTARTIFSLTESNASTDLEAGEVTVAEAPRPAEASAAIVRLGKK